MADRRRIREKERLEDLEDKNLVEEELAEEARKLAEIERLASEK